MARRTNGNTLTKPAAQAARDQAGEAISEDTLASAERGPEGAGPAEMYTNADAGVERLLTDAGYVKGEDGIWSRPDDDAAEKVEIAEPAPLRADIPGFDAKRLTGQLGDFLLDQCKQARHLKPWDKLSEHDQRRLIDHCYETARGVVDNAALTIAAKGFAHAALTLENWQVKDGAVKIVLTGLSTDDAVLALNRTRGSLVTLVFAEPEKFAGKMLSQPQPDQPDLVDNADGGAPEEAEDDAPEEIVDEETGEITTPHPAPPEPQPPAPAA